MSAPWRETRLFLHGPVQALADAMASLPRGTRCRVIVSSLVARYALVPFSSAVVGRAANEALAAEVFRATHGERTDGWRFRVAPAAGLRVACALDASLVDAIAAAAREHGLRLTGIEPAFAAGYNAAYRRLPRSCWFAVIEEGKAVLALLLDGAWRQLRAERCSSEDVLGRLLAREAALADDEVPASLPCWVARFSGDAVPAIEALA